MASISVDVDIEEFDTDDLVSELITRSDLRDRDMRKLIDFIKEQDISDYKIPSKLSLVDKMKWELINNHFSTKSLEDFEMFFS